MADLTAMRAAKRFAKMEYDRQMAGAASGDAIAGIPEVNHLSNEVVDWGTPEGWEAFRRAFGFYPFGMQNGGMVRPQNAAAAPVWAQRLMGGRTLER